MSHSVLAFHCWYECCTYVERKKATGVKCLAVCSCVVVLDYVFTCYHIGVCTLSRVPKSNFLTLLNC